MIICYVDESGDIDSVSRVDSMPLFILGGAIVMRENANSLVMDFLELKRKNNPQLNAPGLQLTDSIAFEMKGSTLRRDIRSTSRNRRRRAQNFISDFLTLLEKHKVQLVGEIFVKATDKGLGHYQYQKSVQQVAQLFQETLTSSRKPGVMILDHRTPSVNSRSVNHLTTQRFKKGGGRTLAALPGLIDSPVFGHSNSHVLLQVADIAVSLVMFCIVGDAVLDGSLNNVHVSLAYSELREKFAERLVGLTRFNGGFLLQCKDNNGKLLGSIDALLGVQRSSREN
jgi:hypothetical protein